MIIAELHKLAWLHDVASHDLTPVTIDVECAVLIVRSMIHRRTIFIFTCVQISLGLFLDHTFSSGSTYTDSDGKQIQAE